MAYYQRINKKTIIVGLKIKCNVKKKIMQTVKQYFGLNETFTPMNKTSIPLILTQMFLPAEE